MRYEIDVNATSRAYAYNMWIKAPVPVVTLIKRLDVSRLVRLNRRRGIKFNLLMCYCIGRAAMKVDEFLYLPVADKFYKYDALAVNCIIKTKEGNIVSCDVPFSSDFNKFSADYTKLTDQCAVSACEHDLSANYMVIGTSALVHAQLQGIVGMYSGAFANPFLFWAAYCRRWFRYYLSLSFQFHHTQMDGEQAARFLTLLQNEIDMLDI